MLSSRFPKPARSVRLRNSVPACVHVDVSDGRMSEWTYLLLRTRGGSGRLRALWTHYLTTSNRKPELHVRPLYCHDHHVTLGLLNCVGIIVVSSFVATILATRFTNGGIGWRRKDHPKS